MELISSAKRNQLFESFAQDAFHLELRDDYSVPDEDSPFTSWLSGETVDYSYMDPWTRLIRRVTGEGKTVRRVRVVTEPHTPYIQWEHATTALNEEAGEEIRWLPRHRLPEGIIFPVGGNDWWLYDDRLLAVGHFAPDGRVLGSELIEDPDTVAECVRLRDLLWSAATPHPEYKP
ncbi:MULTISPECIES: DUF6879 family protein [Streptomyces]|uniref:DUF6879 family protein n=1 Tax=Streptomyces TaxID=1883 RepID=UPI000D1C0A9C|nr:MULTISPECIES: DUF6879 family protein [Streptomyces]MBP5892144.1 hypothetical protein [Streptomyces sp. LBUM 1481]MBP5922378.1 hypothetical protein [Streptomyces sp. LBUM 1483]MDX2685130.1 hypothetical protein [Streptomyces scabiei]MDX2748976.1 hypothetical protein [Streptomyces scabiei]MDX2803151.1 hypothetical protein [Streptomyces scabiei]